MPPPRSKRRVILVGAVALAVGFAGALVWRSQRGTTEAPNAKPSVTPQVAVSVVATASAVTESPLPAVSAPALAPPASASAAPALSAKLSVLAQGGVCEITIDGEPAGKTPIEGMAVAPGEHRVACLLGKGGVVTRRVKSIAGKSATVAFSMVSADPMDKRK